jgi:GNAT superfamily N-acetyltransferase
MSRIQITPVNAGGFFYLEPLSAHGLPRVFACSSREYNDYLFMDAVRSLNDHVAKTWFLREKSTGNLAAYMSLIADAIKLSFTERELHGLKYPFKTIPAMKIAKLAVDESATAKYKGIGSFMLKAAERMAYGLNTDYCAARFLTVDADIEHDKGVLAFYEKNGFILNSELYNKNRKTISMRKDIYC